MVPVTYSFVHRLAGADGVVGPIFHPSLATPTVWISVFEKSSPLKSSGSSVATDSAYEKQSPKIQTCRVAAAAKRRYAARASSACSGETATTSISKSNSRPPASP